MNGETAARWVATAAALVALVVLAVLLGATVAPAVAVGVVLAVSAAVAVALWRRHLDQRQLDRDRRAAAPERSAFTPDQPRF